MQLEIIVTVATGLWIAVVLIAVSLCRAAKLGDDAMHAAVAHAPSTDVEA